MTDVNAVIDKLEPDIGQFAKAFVPRMDCDTMLLFSIAISAKRIADTLDQIEKEI